jgi:hypothetical protein
MSFVKLLEQTYNLRSLVIITNWLDETYASNMENFCSMIPHHIKHLEIDIGIIGDMKIILLRLEHLLSVKFRFVNQKIHWQTKIIRWLSERRDSTYYKDLSSLHIWLGKKNSNTSE